MPASQASNETQLPRAVLRRSAAIAARYAPPEPEAQPAPEAAAAPAPTAPAPAAEGGTTALPTPPVEGDPRANDPNYWQQRFRVTEGLLARERTDNQTRLATLNQRITELQEDLASRTAAATPPAEIDLSKFYTPEQIEAYGEEQCRVMAQTAMDAARTTAQSMIDAAVKPLREEREREREDAATAVKRKFTDRLIELKPDYMTIDQDPRWIAWLAEVDENDVQRQALLDIHVRSGNADAVAKMFKAWERQAARPVPPVTPNGTGASHTTDAAPASAAAVEALTPPTAAEKKSFFTRSALGKVKDDERVAFEARLKLAHPSR